MIDGNNLAFISDVDQDTLTFGPHERSLILSKLSLICTNNSSSQIMLIHMFIIS